MLDFLSRMLGERQVIRPLVARKKGGGRLDLILIESGRTIHVMDCDGSGSACLSYKGNSFVVHERDIHARTVPMAEAALTAAAG